MIPPLVDPSIIIISFTAFTIATVLVVAAVWFGRQLGNYEVKKLVESNIYQTGEIERLLSMLAIGREDITKLQLENYRLKSGSKKDSKLNVVTT